MEFIKASDNNPHNQNLYHTRIRMKDSGLDTFPSANNYFPSTGWEISEDYEVISWLDEQHPAPSLSEVVKKVRKDNPYTTGLGWAAFDKACDNFEEVINNKK